MDAYWTCIFALLLSSSIEITVGTITLVCIYKSLCAIKELIETYFGV